MRKHKMIRIFALLFITILCIMTLCSFSTPNMPSSTDINKVVIVSGAFEALDIEDPEIIYELFEYINAVPRGDYFRYKDTEETAYISEFSGFCYFMVFYTKSDRYRITWLGLGDYFTSDDEYMMRTNDLEAEDALIDYLEELYEENKSSIYDSLDGGLVYPPESDTITQPIETETPPIESDTSTTESNSLPIESDTDTDKCADAGDGGCKSTITGIAIIPAALAAGLVVFRKRKK